MTEILHANRIAPATKEVVDFSEIQSKLELLRQVCEEGNGIGLTSTQIGLEEKMFVMKRSSGVDTGHWINAINPSYKPIKDEGFIKTTEGCLSVPKINLLIRRWKTIAAKWYDENGQEQVETLTGMDAVVFQHEHDHLSAKSILDRFNGQYRSTRWMPEKKKRKILTRR